MCPCITRVSKVDNDPTIELQDVSTPGTSQYSSRMEQWMGGSGSATGTGAVSTQNSPGTSEDSSNMTIKYDVVLMNHSNNSNVKNIKDSTCCSDVLENLVKVTDKDNKTDELGIWIIVGVTNESYKAAYIVINETFLKMEGVVNRNAPDNLTNQVMHLELSSGKLNWVKRRDCENYMFMHLELSSGKINWVERRDCENYVRSKTGCHLMLMMDGLTNEIEQLGESGCCSSFNCEKMMPNCLLCGSKCSNSGLSANNNFTRNLNFDDANLVYLPLEEAMKSSICDKYSGNWEGSKKSNKQDLLIHLFQLCILLNQEDMAFNLWKSLEEKLSAAIGAAKMLKSMSKKTRNKAYKKKIKNSYQEYVERAISILSEYYEEDETKTHDLLRTKWENWGNLTLLQLAVRMRHKSLVSQPAIQSLLNKVWMGKMKEEVRTWRIIHSLILFPIFLHISFREKNEDGNNSQQSKISWKKVLYFYSAPVVTFWLHVFSYLAFLYLYAYVILFNFYPPPWNGSTKSVSISEFVLWAWVFILAIDEFYEISQREHKGIAKLQAWITDFWNILDAVPILLFIIAVALRLYKNTFHWARNLLAISFMVYCWRILNILLVHEAIGPKLIMVRKMIKDVVFFLFILVIFQVSYGVACQALLYPNETDTGKAIQGVFSKPYWQIYGELFLSEIQYNPTADEYSCSNKAAEIAAGYRRCPEVNWLVPVLSAFYMLLSGVILLNLLVAVFTNTLNNMKSKEILYEFQRYELVEMYIKRPPFVPPFSIIYYLWKLLCKVKMLLCKLTSKQSDGSSFNESSDCCEFAEPLVLEFGEKDPVKYHWID